MSSLVLKARLFNLNSMNYIKCLKFGNKILPSLEYYRVLNNSIRNFSCTSNNCAIYFSKKHEWVDVEDGLATVGITHYAQESLGDIVYAQVPDIGVFVERDGECGALESVKAASEIFSPVSGLVVSVNDELEEKPELINKSCYENGWLFKLEMDTPEEVEFLMSKEQYDEYLKTDCKTEDK